MFKRSTDNSLKQSNQNNQNWSNKMLLALQSCRDANYVFPKNIRLQTYHKASKIVFQRHNIIINCREINYNATVIFVNSKFHFFPMYYQIYHKLSGLALRFV